MSNLSQPSLARAPFWGDATFHTTSTAAQRSFSINKPFFVTPPTAGRKITAGFSWMKRISRGAAMDVWFPDDLRKELARITQRGRKIGPHNFPAEWAAVRQFELLQEAGNYRIYDLDADNMPRTLIDLMRSMRGGGYRVTIATIGSYDNNAGDDLQILDQSLQKRLAHLTHMLYLEEQSAEINGMNNRALTQGSWDFHSALPHVGLAIGERELFSTSNAASQKHRLASQFFNILSQLPQSHIVHDTAIGLQLPESINEHEWLYIADGTESFAAFNLFLNEIFTPFNGISLSRLHGRDDATSEIKPTAQHMRGYGDRLTPEADQFHRDAARYALQ